MLLTAGPLTDGGRDLFTRLSTRKSPSSFQANNHTRALEGITTNRHFLPETISMDVMPTIIGPDAIILEAKRK